MWLNLKLNPRRIISFVANKKTFALSLSSSLLQAQRALTNSTRTVCFLCLCAVFNHCATAQSYPGIGREATPAELKAWDIAVRGDFKGLPKGAGSVAKGKDLWDVQCASCHGVFGESNAVFPPLVGDTTPQDRVTGRVAAMSDGTAPYRTTLMKVSQLSTLWDYINRAMPWTAPKSLSTEEVYAVTAYLLNLGGIVADDFTLSDQNIAQVQATLPNRNGKTTQHGLWHVNGKPDVFNTACSNDCGGGVVTSALPDYARGTHGNLAEQNRAFGPYRGVDTSKPFDPTPLIKPLSLATPAPQPKPQPTLVQTPPIAVAALSGAQAPVSAPNLTPNLTPNLITAATVDVKPILNKNSCTACHGMTNKILGPSFSDIAKKHAGKPDSLAYLAGKIKHGGVGAWGAVPMPAQSLSETEAKAVAHWLVNGMKAPAQ
jgi:S-disulfanyl-L-cysteine oxidoreductase SoxD